VDIDLDCPESLLIAPLFLPPTGFKFGRPSNPNSHHFYRCPETRGTIRLKGSDGRKLIECRADGGQTVVPPSVHEGGEKIQFTEMGDPAESNYDHLLLQCRLIATAIELAPHWRNSARHDLSLAVAGTLIRYAVSVSDVCKVIKAICLLTNDEECEDRVRSVETTAERLLRGEPTTGWTRLREHVGGKVAGHIGKWFGGRIALEPMEPDGSPFTRNSLNDAGNAERTKSLFGEDIVYVPQVRQFFRWDGCIWTEDADYLRTSTLCVESIDHYLSEITTGRMNTFNDEKVLKFLRSSKNHGKVTAQLNMLKSMVLCDLTDLDSNPNKLGCMNGVIDLESGKHLPPERSARITKRLGAEFDSDSVCPTFGKLVHDMLGGDEDKIGFVQRLTGYWLTGLTKYHVFPILVGEAGGGKSTFTNAIMSVLGDYATTMMSDTLFEKSAATEARYDLATLRGKRFVVAQEAESQEKIRATTVKALTGEDTLKVRLPYQKPWCLPPCAKFLMVANKRPNLDVFDSGLRRRVLIIQTAPPPSENDLDLGEKLEKEKSGILNWMIAGWVAVMESGFRIPTVIKDATSAFFRDRNEIEGFLRECVLPCPASRVSKYELHQTYREYCLADGLEPRSMNEFGRLLRTTYDMDDGRTNDERYWKDIKLREGDFYSSYLSSNAISVTSNSTFEMMH
jgi:putative DNA primase/helicase